MSQINVLVLGAAYGLLPAVRVLLSGHRVTVVCRTSEQVALAAHGARITSLRRDGKSDTALSVGARIGQAPADELQLAGVDLDLARFDIVFLAMSEPQYASDEVAGLLRRIGQANVPVVSLMNALPPPFLSRLGTIDVSQLRAGFTAWDVWQDLEPALVSAASPDAQAIRPDPARSNELSITLASNFKIAPFAQPAHQSLIETIARDVSAYRLDGRALTVRVIAHPSLFVPLAKWPMLIAGNCRCVHQDGSVVSIADAVGADLEASRSIYDQTIEIIMSAGAGEGEVVPFAHYARAARSLIRPSSFARAISAGAPNIERVDKIVQLSGRSLGIDVPGINQIVEMVDRLMSKGG